MTPIEAQGFINSNAGKVQDAQISVVWWMNGEAFITFGLDGKYVHLALGDAAGSIFRGVIDKLEDHAPPQLENKLAGVRAQIADILGTKQA